MFNVQSQISEIRRRGIVQNNRFLVTITGPKSVTEPSSFNLSIPEEVGAVAEAFGISSLSGGNLISLRCMSATFPGMSLMTKDDILRYGYGPIDKTAYNALFTDVEAQFILDSKGEIYDWIYKWQRSIVDADSSGSMQSKKGGGSPYEVEYRDKYVGDMTVTQYDVTGRKILQCVMHQVYPVMVGDIFHRWDAQNELALLPVRFSYRDHYVRRPPPGTVDTIRSAISFADSLI